MAKTLAPLRTSRSASKSPPPAAPVRAPIHIEISTIALGVVGFTLVSAIAIGFVAGLATAFLAFVTGALLGAILLLWHSLRTLAGDTEIDPALDATLSRAPTALDERKTRALRALKDIEQEHAIGKIDDADFATLDADYRARAKKVIREIDDALDPHRAKAEALVLAHLEKRGKTRAEKRVESDEPAPASTRNACPKCATANDADATFCKKCGAKLTSEPADSDNDNDDDDSAS